jgi:hypothetical protein
LFINYESSIFEVQYSMFMVFRQFKLRAPPAIETLLFVNFVWFIIVTSLSSEYTAAPLLAINYSNTELFILKLDLLDNPLLIWIAVPFPRNVKFLNVEFSTSTLLLMLLTLNPESILSLFEYPSWIVTLRNNNSDYCNKINLFSKFLTILFMIFIFEC